jgi:DNA-directed RNA polymerase subunit RPC12/RpoP
MSSDIIEELEDHSEKMHNIFSKKCTKCDKIFLSSSDFEVHAKTNCKDEEFTCVICKRQFDTKWELARHIKSHIEKSEIKCIIFCHILCIFY